MIILDLDVKEIRELLGIPKPIKREKPDLKFKRIEPEGDILEVPPIKQFHEEFWSRYGDEINQDFDARTCSACGTLSDSKKGARSHRLTHFNDKNYIKFFCDRCKRNFNSHAGINGHARRNQCFIRSDFPEMIEFQERCLADNPKQPFNARECSECGESFKKPKECRNHFLTCVRFSYDCPRCGSSYSSYMSARLHYERDCKSSKNEMRFYHENIKTPPVSEKKIIWTEELMLKNMREKTIPKLRNHLKRFPNGALMLIGKAENPKVRDAWYNTYRAVYNRHQLKPFMDLNEQILFMCWSPYDALLYEFLLQFNLIDEKGEFFAEFGTKINKQTYKRPKVTAANTQKNKPYYVYVKMTKTPWVAGNERVYRNLRGQEFLDEMRQKSPETDISDNDESSLDSDELPSFPSAEVRKRWELTSKRTKRMLVKDLPSLGTRALKRKRAALIVSSDSDD